MSGIGPSFKWITMLDILSQKQQPHELSLTGELKIAPLLAHQSIVSSASGTFEYVTETNPPGLIPPPTNQTFEDTISGRDNTNYFLLLNSSLKAGLEYTYDNTFTLGLGYKLSNL